MSNNNSSYRPPVQTPGYRPPTVPTPQPPKKRKKASASPAMIILIVLILCLALPVILFGVNTLRSHFGGSDASTETVYNSAHVVTEEDIAALQTADSMICSIENPFLIEGYVPNEAAPDCIAEVTDYAEDLVQEGMLHACSNEGGAVWMLHKSGLQTIYVPPKEGTLSFNTADSYSIATIEPYAGTFDPRYDSDIIKNSQAAALLDNMSDQWSHTLDADAQAVTTDIVKNFGENQIILWFGHGAWTSQTGACLITGEFFDAERYRTDSTYQVLFRNGYLARTAGSQSRVAITPKYIEAYAGSMDNSIVFLGTCHSGKGTELVRAFLNKGAQAVVANSDEMRVTYYTDMMYTMVNTLCTRDASGQFNTFDTALKTARQQHGSSDSGYPGGIGAQVDIFGPDVANLRISESGITEPTATPESTDTPESLPDTHELLASYAAQFSYLKGTSGYTGYYTKGDNRSIYGYDVPLQNIAYTIADFDQDNTDELLIARVNTDHTVHLEMYEVGGGSVFLASETDLSTPVVGSAEDSLTQYFYFPRNGRLQISVSEFSLSNHIADGVILRCQSVQYDGHSFIQAGSAEWIGSAWDGEDPFPADMAAMGFEGVSLSDMACGYKLASDYVGSPTIFCTARSMCTWVGDSWTEQANAWFTDDSLTYMEMSYIGFKENLLAE